MFIHAIETIRFRGNVQRCKRLVHLLKLGAPEHPGLGNELFPLIEEQQPPVVAPISYITSQRSSATE